MWICASFKVVGIEVDEVKGMTLESQSGDIVKAKWLITCTGLHADYVAHMAGGAKHPVILPFRGNYKELKPEYRNIIKRNIYPTPDPKSVPHSLILILASTHCTLQLFSCCLRW
jgi:L-2-hydroxyglutarate oxidase LhgO